MKRTLKVVLTKLVLTAALVTAQSTEYGTELEAKQMVQQALAHVKEVGPERAFADFNMPGGKWHKKDIYVFCYRMDGTNLCMGSNKDLVGKNLMDFKNADGQDPVRMILHILKTRDDGWVEYRWLHPLTKRNRSKLSYVAKIPGFDGFLGAGVYK